MSETRNTGIQEDVFNYFTANADRPITLDELQKQFSNFSRSTISSGAARLRHVYSNLGKINKYTYIWNSVPVSAPVKELYLTVLQSKEDGTMLAVNTVNEKVYVCKELDF